MPILLDHLPTETKRTGSTGGGEHAGPCPCCGGEDRFRVWPAEGESGRFWCRGCEWSGDGIALLRSDACGGFTFAEACRALRLAHKVEASPGGGRAPSTRPPARAETQVTAPPPAGGFPSLLRPPGPAWQKEARAFVERCRRALWADTGAAASARSYLTERGFTESTIRAAGLGLNAQECRPPLTSWGLNPKEDKRDGGCVWLPRGIVIPWWSRGGPGAWLWKVNIRRPAGDVERRGAPAGSGSWRAAARRC